MSGVDPPPEPTVVEDQIREWRAWLRRRPAIHPPDVEELEGHLRDQISALGRAGLAADEAFLIAVKRLGSLDALSREFAHEYSERLWKRLVLTSGAEDGSPGSTRETLMVWALAFAAALAIKLPELFGLRIGGGDEEFYLRNASLFVFPLLTVYFVWKRGRALPSSLWLALPFLLAALAANIFPFSRAGDTELLTALHLPIALWFVVGLAYVGANRFAGRERMNFVRFSGELAIYYVLIGLGGGVLTGLTMGMFDTIGIDAGWLAGGWIIPCGAMGAVIVASWLVEAKQSVIENMAPVLTRLFTPLFALVLLVFLGTMAWTGNPIDLAREVLIGFDLLLVLVVGLVLYAASARDPHAPPDLFDVMQLVLVAGALVVDAVALTAIASRISEFGFTPNRVAALGENLILLVNLAVTAGLYGRLLLRRSSYAAVERWQLAYLPVFALWAVIVVVLFPPLFGYR
jgi:hypothetical protein